VSRLKPIYKKVLLYLLSPDRVSFPYCHRKNKNMRNTMFFTILVIIVFIANMPQKINIFNVTLYRPVVNLNFSGINFVRDLNFKLGLDLQGGTHLVYQLDTSKLNGDSITTAVSSTRGNIERRVNLLGVSESIVQTSVVGNDYRLIVELPGVKDVKQAVDTIGQTAQLDFRETFVATPSAAADFQPTGLTGNDLKISTVQFGGGQSSTGKPTVSLEFSPEGAKKFAEITRRNIGKPLAIFLDNYLVTAPNVETEISDGKAVITGNYTLDEAKKLTIQLNAGALPLPIKIIEQRTVGATLGSESVAKSLFAGIVGFIVIALFMIANYGLKGLLADFALTLYVLLSLTIFKIIPVTLTLAGIAGFILSVGMAVDANILIFERIKEELRWGRPKKAALELGFHRAWTSVRDSNVSSLITAGILFWFGTGSVRGFALTLIVGIFVSLFTSITITRTLLRSFSNIPSPGLRRGKGEVL
jgi:preprotein translocase subunit SecD